MEYEEIETEVAQKLNIADSSSFKENEKDDANVKIHGDRLHRG